MSFLVNYNIKMEPYGKSVTELLDEYCDGKISKLEAEMRNVALMRIETFKSITEKCKTRKEYNKRRKKVYHTDGMHYWLHF